jgi:hypothetical protein
MTHLGGCDMCTLPAMEKRKFHCLKHVIALHIFHLLMYPIQTRFARDVRVGPLVSGGLAHECAQG